MRAALAEARRWNESVSAVRVPIDPPRRFEGTEAFRQRTQAILDAERARQASLFEDMRRLSEQFRAAVASGAEQGDDLLPELNTFIGEVSQHIKDDRRRYEAAKREWKQIVKEGRSIAQEVWRALAEVRDQVLDLYAAAHNARVEFYYNLLTLRADYDPEAREVVGPTFDNTRDLVAFLHKATGS